MTNLTNPASTSGEALAQIIEQHISSVNELLEILRQERQALMSTKPEALEQVSATKLKLVNTFKILNDNLNRALGNEKIESLLSRIGDGLNLRQRWQQLLSLTAEAQKNNLSNGALIEERQGYVRHAIKSLFGQEAGAGVYGRAGETNFRPERRIIASA